MAVGPSTDGLTTVLDYLLGAQHLPHYNPMPTGYPEVGGAWVETNNTLTRQNFGLHVAALDVTDPTFGSDVISLLQDHGVSTAPGNAAEIVDFLADVLFGGAITPAERLQAIGYLESDDFGNESPYDDFRIRETTGVLLGYPQFQEQ